MNHRLEHFLDHWRVIFRPICALRKGHLFTPIGLYRDECEICGKIRKVRDSRSWL